MKFILALILIGQMTMLTAQSRFENVTITPEKVSDHLYMLTGAGGNICVSIGEDGIFMIDDQFAPLSERIKASLGTLTNKNVTYLANTHHHGDHTGGNANFAQSGTTIIAHDNVRKRLQSNEALGEASLPVITFSQDASFYINGEQIFLTHVHNAHTDGDALVYFMSSNVLHTGDTFFNGRLPYIDLKSGGSIEGNIAAAKKGILLINDATVIIPGHGKRATKQDYQRYHEMLVAVRDNVRAAMANGATEEKVAQMEELTRAFYSDEETKDDFISATKFRRTVYQSLITTIED